MMNLKQTEFSLIETLLWKTGMFFLLELHLARLKKSAAYFSFSCDIAIIKKKLAECVKSFIPNEKFKIRLLLNSSGNISLKSEPIIPLLESPLKTGFSDKKTDKTDPFFKHKTTNRSLYNSEYLAAKKNGFFDVIFLNQANEITEGSISNIIIQKNNEYFTPPLICGLLPGVYRTYLLETEDLPIKETVLKKEDIVSADKIFLVNSVRKMVPVLLS